MTNQIFIDMKNDLTEFFGLIRKLANHGWSEGEIKAMVGGAFWYFKVKNDLSKDINIWFESRKKRIIELNPHLEE